MGDVMVPILSAAPAVVGAGVSGCRRGWRAERAAVPVVAGASVGGGARRCGRPADPDGGRPWVPIPPAAPGGSAFPSVVRCRRGWVPASVGASACGCRPAWRAGGAAVPAVVGAGGGGCRRGRVPGAGASGRGWHARGGCLPSARGRGPPVPSGRPRPTPPCSTTRRVGAILDVCGILTVVPVYRGSRARRRAG